MTDLVRRLVGGHWDWVLVEPGAGGGDLPDWWTVDSTPGSESVEFAGTVAIAPGADVEALVITAHPGVDQATLPFQFYDEDGLLAVDIDSQGILDVRRVSVQDPPDTAASGEGSVVFSPAGVLISMGPNPAPGRSPLRVDKWEPGAGTYKTVLAVGQNFTDGMLQLQPSLNEPVVEITAPEDDVGEAIRLWDHVFNAQRFVLDYTGAVTISPSGEVIALTVVAGDDGIDAISVKDTSDNVVASMKPTGIYAAPTQTDSAALFLDATFVGAGGKLADMWNNGVSVVSFAPTGAVTIAPTNPGGTQDAVSLLVKGQVSSALDILEVRDNTDFPVFEVNALGEALFSPNGFANAVAISGSGAIDMKEQSAPAAPAANTGRLYVKDTGGKSQLLVRFPSGAAQVIATEP